MKKKLLVTGSTFPRWEGDTEPRFVLDLSEALTEYYDVTVLVPAAPGAADQEIMNGVKVIRYHYFPIHKWETLCYPGAIVPRIREKKIRALLVPFLCISLYWHLFRMLKDYDMVHAHWLIPQGIVQSFFKTPYIVTGHGGDVTSLNHGIVKKLKQRCLKKASFITAVSEPFADAIQVLWKNHKTSVISMGCNTANFSPSYRKENCFSQGSRKVILFVGRLAEKKGVTYLIDAMNYVDARLVIVGSGPLESELRDQAKPLREKIQFLGARTHEELKTIYASADVFAAPSVTAKDGDKEGFGLVILEAMASGLPVAASRSGGIVDIIRDGENGLLSDERNVWQLADNLSTLLDDAALYKKLSENALETARQFDYEVIAEKYAQLFEKGQTGVLENERDCTELHLSEQKPCRR